MRGFGGQDASVVLQPVLRVIVLAKQVDVSPCHGRMQRDHSGIYLLLRLWHTKMRNWTDCSPAQTENQPSMTRYVETDERQDVLASLDHCVMCLVEAKRSDGAWKWVILSLHSALQGAMVCHLSGTAGIGALTSKCAQKWNEWHERDRRGEIESPPRDHVASADDLFERLATESKRIESGCGQIIEVTSGQKKSFKRLHALRNKFTHFSPQGWSIELQLIEEVVLDMLDVIAQIADDPWPFRHLPPEEWELLRTRVVELRRSLRELLACGTCGTQLT